MHTTLTEWSRLDSIAAGHYLVDMPVSPADWAQAAAPAEQPETTELADTGASSTLLAVIAVAVIVAGGLMVETRRRMV